MRQLNDEERRVAKRQLYDELEAGTLDLAGAVRRMRLITGLSQSEFARRIAGISPISQARIEAGTGNPTVGTLTKIGRAFGLSLGFVRRADKKDRAD
jgi:transcriptional regulator with XRE-family HTH domain